MFNFAITPLGNLFFGLTLIVFLALVVVKNPKRAFFLHALLLTALGFIFYASDLITLFIGWEVMTWSSYFIIAKTAQLRTLQKYILFNLGAGFALLGAIVLIYSFSGSLLYSEIDLTQAPTALTLSISLLLFLTIFIKSGVVPFHYWVVDSYTESNHLFSAILSAILSKAGIFLFILMATQIVGYQAVEAWLWEGVAWLGVLTSIVATFKAIAQDELKRLLAYSSIAQLGYIITVLAVSSSSGAMEAGLYHTLIHTFVKLLLFINVAAIIVATGQSRLSQLGALLYRYPTLFILLLIGIIALAGMPPLGGFNSKFLIYTTLLAEKKALLLTTVMFSSASAFLYCYKLIYGIYLGQPTQASESYQKVPVGFYIPQFIGAIVVVILGFVPSLGTALFNPILLSLGMEPIAYNSLFELTTPFASFNGGVIMGIFVVLFVVILLLALSLKNRAVSVRDRLDISYCGETPDEANNLHYGYGMGQELKRIGFIRLILKNSVQPYWEHLSTMVQESASLLKRLYALGVQNIAVLILLFFTTLLFLGVQ